MVKPFIAVISSSHGARPAGVRFFLSLRALARRAAAGHKPGGTVYHSTLKLVVNQ